MISSAAAQSQFNFDAAASRTARDRGIKAATSRANPEWFAQMIECGKIVARRQATLTNDDIVQEYSKDPSRPVTGSMRAMSGVTYQLRREGYIEPTGEYRATERETMHRAPIRVYRSLVYRNSGA